MTHFTAAATTRGEAQGPSSNHPSQMVCVGAEVNSRKPKASDYIDVVPTCTGPARGVGVRVLHFNQGCLARHCQEDGISGLNSHGKTPGLPLRRRTHS